MITYNEEYFNQINIFAKKNNLKVLYLASSKSIKKIQGWIYPRTGVGVEEFLDVIHNAKYFFTDSYHGTLFGLQLSKKMLILKRFKDSDPKNQNSRLLQILNLYNIKNIYVDEYNIKKVINNIPDVDYSQVHKEIDIQRKESILWLLNNIETLKKRI